VLSCLICQATPAALRQRGLGHDKSDLVLMQEHVVAEHDVDEQELRLTTRLDEQTEDGRQVCIYWLPTSTLRKRSARPWLRAEEVREEP
jgi:hypothetical protein